MNSVENIVAKGAISPLATMFSKKIDKTVCGKLFRQWLTDILFSPGLAMTPAKNLLYVGNG